MKEIIVSDALQNLKKEVKLLQLVLSALLAERVDLQEHICPELVARYAREIGDYENRVNYQKIIILETKRRIEIARAALNREKAISKEEVDRQVEQEYQRFHEKLNEAFQKAERDKKEESEREEQRRRYEKDWQERFGNKKGAGRHDAGNAQAGDDADDSSSVGDDTTAAGETKNASAPPDAKELFRKIVKKLHPDINPDITEHEKELFDKAVKAYKDGDLATLQEIYDEVFGGDSTVFNEKELSYDELTALRDKLKGRIQELSQEIQNIKSAFPYREKDFLDDAEAVANRRTALEKVIQQNEDTLKRLTQMLEEINQEMDQLHKKKR